MKIEDMLSDYKDLASLKSFTEAQHNKIIELNKKVQELEQKNKKLTLDLQNSSLSIVDRAESIIKSGTIIEDHEENICRMELKRLHDSSMDRALTFEETKKVEIFTKLLLAITNKPRIESREVKEKNTGELLQLVGNEDK